METTYMFSNRGIDKENVCVHPHTHTMEYYSAIKEGNPAIVTTRINLEDIMLSEINQIEKEKYCI